ncbi:TetR/AcrR family transcriptional regulator [Rhodococcus sp. BS-15]|uniref:TetR/AcrR family transcriptional regulator n=1 Tax=Rhodococcus sp. BS-15 TaxID=1304954 RepID=UPI000A833F93|nr:TetR/AcrR family transcriptional regulator [Rhodococcus sp. BS-15]
MATERYHHGDLRKVLLDEAERSIAHGGVDALSLRQLARDVGVSHGAPARHFRDKQALLDALALHGFEELNRRMVAAATGPGELMARFRAVARAYLGFAVEHPELLDVMYSTKHHPDASEKLKSVAHESMTATEALLSEAIAAGVITELHPRSSRALPSRACTDSRCWPPATCSTASRPRICSTRPWTLCCAGSPDRWPERGSRSSALGGPR